MSTESSRAAVMQKFTALSATGQSVMDDIGVVHTNTLLAFQQFLSQANLMKTRVDRICAPGVMGRFVVSDLLGVDLPHTTASLRPDATAVTLCERGKFVPAVIKTTTFSTDKGTYQLLNNTYKVMSQTGTPTGTFRVEFLRTILGNLVVFDLLTPTSDGTVKVSGIAPDFTEFPADTVSRNGYRVCAWLPTREMRYLKIAITPSGPDIAGGLGYTFGITDLNTSSLTFHLASDLVMKPITITPTTPKAMFRAPETEGLTYFLSYDGAHFSQVAPNSTIELPGCAATAAAGCALDVDGKVVGVSLPLDLAQTTLRVIDSTGDDVPALFNLHVGQTPATKCMVVSGEDLLLKPFSLEDDGNKTFSVRYNRGPASLQVWLKVKFTATSTFTPVFSGAYLEEVHE
jgi:hypothetical protein